MRVTVIGGGISGLTTAFLLKRNGFDVTVFDGEPKAKDGFVDLDEGTPGLGLTDNEPALQKFDVLE